MSKLTFNITEIPEGESRKELTLASGALDVESYGFKGGEIAIDFYRGRRFIRTRYKIEADVELVCDRSLEEFLYPVSTSYEVVFKTDVQEETETKDGAVRRFDFSANTISIEKEVRDSVMLEIPIKKIHPKYLNDEGNIEEFETKSFGNTKQLDEDEDKVDPRWEKLKELKDNN
ncbi:MAG TPA: DUF177 domain-containing protein [Balneolaceae bacterium]|nr:DUF177 domain-containing protein [Balneolaceae bacterium]